MKAGRRHQTWIQTLFGVAVAALAAAFSSPLVELLSNRGVFGRGAFTDGSNADVLPVTLAGLLLLAGFLAVRIRHSYFGPGAKRQRHELATALSTRSVFRMLPFVFFVQIALLWAMETVEQRVVLGHVLGSTIWLGGPALASLTIHAAICLGAALLARRILIVVEPRAVRIVRAVLALLAAVFKSSSRPIARHRGELPAAILSPVLHYIGKRGPPQPHLS